MNAPGISVGVRVIQICCCTNPNCKNPIHELQVLQVPEPGEPGEPEINDIIQGVSTFTISDEDEI